MFLLLHALIGDDCVYLRMLNNKINNTTLIMIRTPCDGLIKGLSDRNKMIILQMRTHDN